MQRAKLKVGDVVSVINYKHTPVAHATPAIIMDIGYYENRWHAKKVYDSRRTQYIGIAQQREQTEYCDTEEEAQAFAATLSGPITIEPHEFPAYFKDRRGAWHVTYEEWNPAPGYLPYIVAHWPDVLVAKMEYDAKREADSERNRLRAEANERKRVEERAERDKQDTIRKKQLQELEHTVNAPWKALGIKATPIINILDGSYICRGFTLDIETSERVLKYLQGAKKGL